MSSKTAEQAHTWYVEKRQNNAEWREKNKRAAKAWRERKREDPEWVKREQQRARDKKK